MIEEFIEGKAYLEVTLVNNQIRFISQIGLSKTMKLQQKWRAFPIKLPENIFEKIKAIIDNFSELTSSVTEPIRFSFTVKNAEPILLSINSDNSRLEYQEEWRKQTELEPLAEAIYPAKTKYISKINIYNGLKENKPDFTKAVEVCEFSKAKYDILNNKLYFMITSETPKNLSEDYEKANAVIKQIIDGLA